MALKDTPARLLIETYPLRFTTRILYADMDAFRHLNNGATGRYLEEGRADLNMRVFGRECMIDPPGGLQILFANVTIDYIRQAHYPGEVEVLTGIAKVGGSSYVLAQAARQHGECFALAEAVMVKAIDGASSRLSDAERAAMAPLMLTA
ncbi:acyl-CoA thioesterase [Sphingomonas immobilis]|uniref:Acyl-CoA thioesterase n=1 Tax=Sphingomonas immobilis TaxID=3063997 RepID=A0ABT8ZX56_9SPHN|nr:acyl-CoA thioesterase [Sphingomonas sp. CA1-15]MDO7842157.1 acyl-CoA thioesterase [Sphingomonas sp. CA1-15]